MHPLVYWKKKIEKPELYYIMCLGVFWRKLHCGLFLQSYYKWFFITYNGYLLVIILSIDLTVWNIEDRKQKNTEHYWTIYWIWHYLIMMEQSLREMCSGGVMEVELGCDWVLISSQRFKISVNTILDITSFCWFSLDITREQKRIFDSSPSSFWGGSTIINLNSSKYLFLYSTEIFCLFLWRVRSGDFLLIVLFFFCIL